ncbi:MAG: heterocyst frequency control protein PatD [Cyanobacteria bacterium J06638_38]
MLPASHDRAYQDFLTLLTEFNNYLVVTDHKIEQSLVNQRFQKISRWYEEQILQLDNWELEAAISSRWRSVQTEIKREFQLLSVDVLFFSSARQQETKFKRIKNIKEHISKLIGYCQIMLHDNN